MTSRWVFQADVLALGSDSVAHMVCSGYSKHYHVLRENTTHKRLKGNY